jgi:ribosomal protein S18 acetylase RimI-like enzyme
VVIEIRPARLPSDVDEVRRLFREYAEGLGFDLGFQGFDEELATLPGKYAPPEGLILLARDDAEAVGCVAFRPIDQGACEMKRLFVQPRARGSELGRRLAERVCVEARAAGYDRISLDTVPTMSAAIALYRSLGFRERAPYVFNPIEGAIFLSREL